MGVGLPPQLWGTGCGVVFHLVASATSCDFSSTGRGLRCHSLVLSHQGKPCHGVSVPLVTLGYPCNGVSVPSSQLLSCHVPSFWAQDWPGTGAEGLSRLSALQRGKERALHRTEGFVSRASSFPACLRRVLQLGQGSVLVTSSWR